MGTSDKGNDFIKIEVEKLIEWNEPNGEGCIVSDKITKYGLKAARRAPQFSKR